MGEKELKKTLMQENQEFKAVVELHQKYDDELEKLESITYLSESEKLRIRELKKKKLALKDKMYVMMTEYRKSSK
ncbi:MAG: DUF465 domain-containing protein [Candidatus Aminicenantes bacterium]|jgi:hypothetical protein|nr:DUF465 domain-containing protein [Candidatus Aminicenantes bacterium]